MEQTGNPVNSIKVEDGSAYEHRYFREYIKGHPFRSSGFVVLGVVCVWIGIVFHMPIVAGLSLLPFLSELSVIVSQRGKQFGIIYINRVLI